MTTQPYDPTKVFRRRVKEANDVLDKALTATNAEFNKAIENLRQVELDLEHARKRQRAEYERTKRQSDADTRLAVEVVAGAQDGAQTELAERGRQSGEAECESPTGVQRERNYSESTAPGRGTGSIPLASQD
jgi:hypothetical protein